MGVKGWNSILRQEGFLPAKEDLRCCSCSLWRDHSTMDSNAQFASRLEAIPRGSTLHIDGNGLAYFLHSVAYARHLQNVLSKDKASSTNRHRLQQRPSFGGEATPCSLRKRLSKLSTTEARRILPSFMPMSVLSEVTREFISQLKDQHKMNLIIYWDGAHRLVFKEETLQKRQERIPEEWSNLQMYCSNGILPPVAKLCELESLFPKCRYWRDEIVEVMTRCAVDQIHCQGEADADIARAASGNPLSYVVGQDSDFCFFPRVRYIPLDTLDASNNSHTVTGSVLERQELARELGLASESLMVETAILLGNDYISLTNDVPLSTVLEFMKEQPADFQVTSQSDGVQEKLRYVRALYELLHIDETMYDETKVSGVSDDDDISAGDEIATLESDQNSNRSVRPSLPSSIEQELLLIDFRSDKGIKDAIIRCLHAYQELVAEGEDIMVTVEHVAVFESMDCSKQAQMDELPDKEWRPRWKDVSAAYVLERLISLALKQKSPIAHMSLPSDIFDQHYFLHLMFRFDSSDDPLPSSKEETTDIFDEKAVQSRPFEVGEKEPLPVDEHESIILDCVARNRVTIIKGETGCGKSSRIPIMVLNAPPPDPALREVRMFISQPRRIAAKGLTERVRSVEPDIGKRFALRLGHGVREYESEETRAWFCTTGYLVRLLANHPERFDDISHLIIDEIHDRGVDLDLLCLLCRRLLRVNKHIRLILMSATLASALYQDYFGVSEPPIEVGAKRFPVEEVYLDNLPAYLSLSQKAKSVALGIANECEKLRCQYTPSFNYMEKLAIMTAHIVASIASGGTSILVFVPGMNEIISIMDLVEQLFVPGITFSCIPVHSDIPFEDQLAVFSQTHSDECRVVVATNSAESSVTLPALDHVIDLGLCRQIVYNPASHRQLLTSAWISRASATQRKGRTGRIAPGTVYRLYTKSCFENFMEPFEPGEMLRIPLDSVILMLKGILKEGEPVSQILLECLEPPNASTIDRSFQSLNESRYITSPDDSGEITNLGAFVSALGVDLSLGSLIGLGIQFGVGPESIWLAGVLSFPKTPWIMSNPLVHGPKEFNTMAAKTLVSRFHFEKGLYSEPFALINLIWDYNNATKKAKWCWDQGIHEPRLKRLASACSNLQRKVADLMSISPDNLDLEAPCSEMPESKLTILRAIQVWVFHETMIEWTTKKKPPVSNSEYTLGVDRKSDSIQSEHLTSILKQDKHPFSVRNLSSTKQTGVFSPVESFWASFEERLLSYAIEKDFLFIFYRAEGTCVALIHDSLTFSPNASNLRHLLESRFGFNSVVHLKAVSGRLRGIGERACGRWRIDENTLDGSETSQRLSRYRVDQLSSRARRALESDLNALLRVWSDLKHMSLQITIDGDRSNYSLQISNAVAVSRRDLQDILQSLNSLQDSRIKETLHRQEIVFPIIDSKDKKALTNSMELIPDGARILYALAAAARRTRLIKLQPLTEESDDDDQEEEDMDYVALHLEPIGKWTRLSSGSVVYLPDLSHISCATPLDYSRVICVCANSLEIRGGALKVEGLSILPDGKLFALLCQLCFGLEKAPEENPQLLSGLGQNGEALSEDQIDDVLQRCSRAQRLNEASLDLGEELVCDPTNVSLLLEVFHGINGKSLQPWKSIEKNPFIRSVLKKSRRLLHVPRGNSYGPPQTPPPAKTKSSYKSTTPKITPESSSRIPENGIERIPLPSDYGFLFSTSLEGGQKVSEFDLPSTNIMALIIQSMSLNGENTLKEEKMKAWSLLKIHAKGNDFYQARFDDRTLAGTKFKFSKDRKRPVKLKEAMECIPGSVHDSVIGHVFENKQGLFFESIESAAKLEASFWLEHHFGDSSSYRWYQITFDQMLRVMDTK